MRAHLDVESTRAAGRVRLTLNLVWSRADPLAVRLVLCSEPDHPAMPSGRWVVLRDFLRYALEEPTGDGDVRMTPVPAEDRLVLTLAGRRGRVAVVRAVASEVREFLDRTEREVPSGAERAEGAVDALIEALLKA